MKRIITIDEQAFIDALRHAFAEDKEPTTLTYALAPGALVPLSRLIGEQRKALRAWVPARIPASLLWGGLGLFSLFLPGLRQSRGLRQLRG